MKKRFALAFAAILALCLALVGCGGGGGGGEAADPKANFIGTWEIQSMEQDGESMSEEDLAMMRELGLSVYLVLNEDGTGSIEMFGEALEGTWEAKNATTGTFTAEDQTVDMTLEGGTLTMTQEGTDTRMVFAQIDPEDMVTPDTSGSTDGGDDSGSASGIIPSGGSSASGNYIDSYGNVNGVAALELNGREIAALAQENGYIWHENSTCWLRQSDMAAVGAFDENLDLMSQSQMESLAAGAAGTPCIYLVSSAGYSSEQDAFDNGFGLSPDDVAYTDSTVVAKVSDGGAQYLVVTIDQQDGTYTYMIFNEASCDLFNSWADGNYGSTIDEIWTNLVG